MDRRQMAERCPAASLVGPSLLQAHRFTLNGRGVATIVPDPATVHGVLWLLTERCEEALDRYEGVAGGYYDRVHLDVVDLGSGATVNALVYVGPNVRGSQRRPGYMQAIVEAARAHAFPDEYVRELAAWLA